MNLALLRIRFLPFYTQCHQTCDDGGGSDDQIQETSYRAVGGNHLVYEEKVREVEAQEAVVDIYQEENDGDPQEEEEGTEVLEEGECQDVPLGSVQTYGCPWVLQDLLDNGQEFVCLYTHGGVHDGENDCDDDDDEGDDDDGGGNEDVYVVDVCIHAR